jgi:tetratricopeptide (TPR) repeat protein
MSRIATIFIAVALVTACSRENVKPAEPKAPLYDNLGSLHHQITTASSEAQRYFDQGLTLSYAFNHAEAIRSFRQAAALDADCAMCYWGVAFALGPNINAPITPEAARDAFAAIEQARQRAAKASAREQAYIAALAKRYTSDPKADRPPLDAAYAAAMKDVVAKFPDDLDAATLYAQSLMDTAPWNYWNADGSPRAFTNDVLASLESVLKRKSDHPGAIHLYIHAVEASPDPKRAEAYADKLPALVPGAGHLVHMPAHIYLRTGRYNDASTVNEDAMKADAAYKAGNAVAGNMTYDIGYIPHNPHFFVASASLEGRRTDALRAADEVRGKVHADMLRDPAMGGMVQHFALTPLFTKVRFAMWDEVLAEPLPPADIPYMQAITHAARSIAYSSTGRLDEAEKELEAVMTAKGDASLKTTYISTVNLGSSVADVAYDVAAGELRARQKRAGEASRHFEAAAAKEAALTYMEPPDWPIPVRQLQGAAMLAMGRAADAEKAFREDLKRFPNNGWSLSGLRESRIRQGRQRDGEIASLDTALGQAWRLADVKIEAGRVVR